MLTIDRVKTAKVYFRMGIVLCDCLPMSRSWALAPILKYTQVTVTVAIYEACANLDAQRTVTARGKEEWESVAG